MNEPSVALTVPETVADISLITGAGEARPIEVLAILKAIDRLDDAIVIESETLRSGGAPSFEDFNYRKSHGLLELTRAMRVIRPEQVGGDVRDRLLELRARLEGNRLLLKTHLDATREISEILTAALRNSESDGTYSAAAGQRGRP